MALRGGELTVSLVVAASTRDMTREQWFEERRKGIGGSDAAAVAGLSRYRTPIQVYMEKLGLIDPPEENEAMYWGKKLEDLVAEEFSQKERYPPAPSASVDAGERGPHHRRPAGRPRMQNHQRLQGWRMGRG
jgi:hypothetical protein